MRKIREILKDIPFENNKNLHLIILVLLPFIIYIRVISFGLTHFDDGAILNDVNNKIEETQKKYTDSNSEIPIGKFGDSFYRPVHFITNVIDATISGHKPWMYHLSNLVIHIITVICLYYFLKFFNFKPLTAFLLSLFFSVHPLLASDIAWIPSRGDLLIGLMGMPLFILLVKHFQTGKSVYFILHVILFLLIVLTKETAVLFPFLLLFYYLFILEEKSGNVVIPIYELSSVEQVQTEHTTKWKALKWKAFWNKELLPYYISWIIVIVFYLFIRSKIIKVDTGGNLFGFSSFVKNLSVLPIIFGKFFLPINLSTLPLYSVTSTVIGIIIFILVVYAAIKYTKEKKWFILMGLGWYFIFSIPPMFFRLPDAKNFFEYLEHRQYLPIIGIIILCACFLDRLLIQIKSKYIIYISISVLFIFSVLAFIHSGHYKDSIALFTCAINENPTQNSIAYDVRGEEYLDVDKLGLALLDFNNSIKILDHEPAYLHRGIVESKLKDHSSAEKDFYKAISLDSMDDIAYVKFAEEQSYNKNFMEAIKYLDKAAMISPANPLVYYQRGNMYLSLKDYIEAIKNYYVVTSLDSLTVDAYINRGIAKYEIKDYLGAIEDYKKVTEINPFNIIAYNNTGVTLRELNRLDEAMEYFNKVISMKSDFGAAYYGRATVKQRKGDFAGACEDLSVALSYGYEAAKGLIDKYCNKQK